MSKLKHREGSCLCGHVRFQTKGEPLTVSNCHCHMCQKATGAAFLTLAEFPAANVVWIGEGPKWRSSSEKAERAFCPECGGAVAYRHFGDATVEIAVALLDGGESFAPTYGIHTESAQPWTTFDPTIPHFKKNRT